MISYTLPPLYSGAGTQALRLAKKLREKGVSVFMLTAKHARTEGEGFIEGIKVHRLPVFGPKRIKPLTFALAASLFLLRNHRTYDMVHLHGAYWRIVPIIWITKLLGKKIVVKMTLLGTDDLVTIRRRLFGFVLAGTVAMADAVVAINDGLANGYLQAGLPPERLIRIPNGVDTNCFRPVGSTIRQKLRETFAIPPGIPIVLFVGVVNWRKGVDLLLTAWPAVQEQFPEATLMLVGPISTASRPHEHAFRQYLHTYVTNHGRSHHIRILRQQAEVERFYQMADVFVLPSRLEGLPNALLEAMACGLPVVATAVGGTPEVIKDNGNGVLVPPNDESALSSAMLRLIQNPALTQRFGKAARKTILAHYSMEAVVDQYVRLYNWLTDSAEGLLERADG
jgi:glycosyltransferase involved in cell wall biosynthesis